MVSFNEIKKLIQAEKLDSIQLKFIDLKGSLRRVTISASEFNEKLLKLGIGFDGSSVTGFRKVSAGDLVLIPDLTTMHFEPFSNKKLLSFMCDIKEADTREQFPDDPRFIAKKAIDYINSLNIADEAYFAPEYEFYLFSKVSYDSKSHYSFYHIDTEEGYWNNEFNENDVSYLAIDKHQGYHKAFPEDRYFFVRDEVINVMKDLGMEFRYHHHEVGGPSQHEIEIPLIPIFNACETTIWVKYIVKNIARKHGLFATFMPKPLSSDAGSGMHCHITLKKDGKNLFYGNNYANLSKEALYFIGGILKHGKALTAIANPTINSFKRLVPGFEAPTNLFFSLGNRSAAIRIPKYSTNSEDIRIEFRTPDASSNPYFALPAILMAGIDGIQNKIDPEKNNFGPIDKNIFDLSEKELSNISSIPKTLEQALEELEKDNDFLRKGNVFTEGFLDSWINTKIKEIEQFRHSVDPLEYKLYFNV